MSFINLPESSEKSIIITGSGPHTVYKLERRVLQNCMSVGSSVGSSSEVDTSLSINSKIGDLDDRTEALRSGDAERINALSDRVFQYVRGEIMAILSLREEKRGIVVGVSCNTFHAPQLWAPFEKKLTNFSREKNLDTTLVHMPREVVAFVLNCFSTASKIGVLSTIASHEHGVYSDLLQSKSTPQGETIEMIEVDDLGDLHQTIYNEVSGLKKIGPEYNNDWARPRMENHLRELKRKGAKVIILGCTELRFVLSKEFKARGGIIGYFEGIPLIDSSVFLARALIAEAIKNSTRFQLKDFT